MIPNSTVVCMVLPDSEQSKIPHIDPPTAKDGDRGPARILEGLSMSWILYFWYQSKVAQPLRCFMSEGPQQSVLVGLA